MCLVVKIVFKDSDILFAINQLKTKKVAGLGSLCAEHVKYAHGVLCSHLATLFTACCRHGSIPNNLYRGRITLVPKNECLNHDFSDFKPIATINVLAKVLEYCLLDKFKDYLLLIHYSLVLLKLAGV